MHICRIRYTVLGLLIYYLQNAYCSSCVSDFDDVASKTVMADIVFEGQYYREVPVKERPGFYNIRFNKITVIKGTFPDEQPAAKNQKSDSQQQQQQRRENGRKQQQQQQQNSNSHGNSTNQSGKRNPGTREISNPIIVGQFGPAHDQSDCVYSRKSMNRGQRYLVFLAQPEWQDAGRSRTQHDSSKDGRHKRQRSLPYVHSHHYHHQQQQQQQQSPVVYRMSSFPLASSGSLRKEAISHNCQNCGKIPKIAKLSRPQNVTEGRRLKVTCRSTGFPKPEMFWLKNGILLEQDNDVTIKDRKLSSVLVVKGVKDEDTGQYQCYAINTLGQSNLSSVFVTVLSKTKKPFSERCSDQSYCVNGGTCYILTTREHYFCQCTGDFIGERCEEKNTGYTALMGRKKKRSLHRRHHRLIRPRMRLI